jgi:hypothetical protein
MLDTEVEVVVVAPDVEACGLGRAGGKRRRQKRRKQMGTEALGRTCDCVCVCVRALAVDEICLCSQ